MSADKIKNARDFIECVPQVLALKMELVEIADGAAVIRMPYDPQIVGDPETGVIHGGAVSTLMDTCCGTAVIAHPDNPGGTATISLRIDYLRAAAPGQAVTARAECYHLTRSVAFVRGTAHDEETGCPVATATGTFTVETKA
ncbi:PaaI family thioesterase [Salipiger abyssi]|uniref:PaaI family thioesterase n=1 Tax=Salipiger abyssi TaxID=1250539 RepID=UPI001A8FAD55|nr:PaaI family thioesterase [Salipiger abyssi]MBN9887623.1 PaaI family thioesterase [Salipiger abyssi]